MNAISTLGQHTLMALELLATAAFALSGVMGAMRKRLDIVGVCVCGFLAAFGGGTLRDLLIDRRPFFWVEHQSVLMGVLALCIVSATVLKQRHVEWTHRSLQWPDALGLGLFCATGVHLSWNAGQPALVAILMGTITGAFGGVLRDLVCNEIPTLFRDHRPYAVCAFAGGIGYVVTTWMGWPDAPALAVCALLTTGLRGATLWLDWRLPAQDA
jgi:uncharacterized membrane protein YeiH